jgi:hypothetical protein
VRKRKKAKPTINEARCALRKDNKMKKQIVRSFAKFTTILSVTGSLLLAGGYCALADNRSTGAASSLNPGVLPPGSLPAGQSYDAWTAAWWQWALSIPAPVNPMLDPTGANAAQGQSGNVWFLAGTFGGGPATRTITVPPGKFLFFPLVNFLWITTCPEEPQTADTIRPIVSPPADVVSDLGCSVDNKVLTGLTAYRTESPIFQVNMPDNNVFGVPAGQYGPSLDAGYYLMLPPLPAGEHVIHFHAALPTNVGPITVVLPNPSNPCFPSGETQTWGAFTLDVTYRITVER